MQVKVFSSAQEAAEAIPQGTLRLIIVNSKKIAMAHSSKGYSAFDNACPHQNEGLSKGALTRFNEVVCPLHFYRFNLMTGRESSNRCQALNTYPIKIVASGLYIEM